jgi:hypothetical protein
MDTTIGPAPLLTFRLFSTSPSGCGVICETRALPGAVIPAKAGIHCASDWKCAANGLDSRLRGNDQCFGGDPIPNDTTTPTITTAVTEASNFYSGGL